MNPPTFVIQPDYAVFNVRDLSTLYSRTQPKSTSTADGLGPRPRVLPV